MAIWHRSERRVYQRRMLDSYRPTYRSHDRDSVHTPQRNRPRPVQHQESLRYTVRRPVFQKPQVSRLLSLPPELRNQIYDHLLVADRTVRIIGHCRRREGLQAWQDFSPWSTAWFRRSPAPLNTSPKPVTDPCRQKLNKFHTAVLQTCRLVHVEAAHVLYRDNTFSLLHSSAQLAFLRTIGATNIRSLRVLRVEIVAEAMSVHTSALALLAEASGLRSYRCTGRYIGEKFEEGELAGLLQ